LPPLVQIYQRKEGYRKQNQQAHYQDLYIEDSLLHPLDDATNRLIKRTFDIAFSAAVIIILLSWLLPLLAVLIKVTSKGPVFFVQKRHGINNKTFRCLKLRTMRTGQEHQFKQATRNDDRVTPLGRFLRKTSLDEMPQFLNALVGDMAVVGPRPHALKHNEKFSPAIRNFWQRHTVKPGITGLAQIRGYRGDTSTIMRMKNRVRLDIFYIQNWTFILDVKIVWMTVVSLLRGDQNAF